MMSTAARINKLQDYISVYYEDDIEGKLQASKNILELFQDFDNLKTLLEHDSLMSVLSRTLAENHKRNIDLSVYTLSIFYILSNYVQFQEIIAQNVIGKTVIDVIENQIQRFDLMYSEYIQTWRKNQEKDRITAKSQLKKLNVLIWKQDKLFFVCINILLNISYDPNTQKKMRKVGIVQLLIRCLQRNDFHLLLVTLVFLRKLATIGEYKKQMIECDLVNKLQRFFTCDSDALLNLALLVYYNLAFDPLAREVMEKSRLIPKFVQLLAQDSYSRMTSLKILYLLSTEAPIRYTLAYTSCMEYVVKLILVPHSNVGAIELLALAINLASNDRNVENINQQDFGKLIQKAVRSQDPTFLKFIKNILRSTKSQGLHNQMIAVIRDKLIKLVMSKSKNEQMSLQVLGIMTNSRLGKQWTDIMLGNDKFIDFLEKTLINGTTEDDILMQVVMLVANICQQAECCSLLEQLFQPILALFLNKQYDAEFIGQSLHTIYSFIFHCVGLQRILSEHEVVMRIMELIDDPNEGVRQINDQVLTVLKETDDIQLNEQIKQSKFYQHNKKWLTETEGIHDWVYDSNPYAFNEDMLDPRMWESEDDYD